jgi:hypothetical protein
MDEHGHVYAAGDLAGNAAHVVKLAEADAR